MKRNKILVIIALSSVVAFGMSRPSIWDPIYMNLSGKRTVAGVVAEYGDRIDASLRPLVERAGLAYTPKRVAFLCFKEEKRLELWGQDDGPWVYVSAFDIKAASGEPGPKLKEGDRQVPEGLYRIEGLNPNSAYHLSLKLNYPNEFDVARARAENRADLGGDIFIHGKDASIGCLAMGDEAAEELFVLTNRVGKENVRVLIAPCDFRRRAAEPPLATAPNWLPELYTSIASELENYRGSTAR